MSTLKLLADDLLGRMMPRKGDYRDANGILHCGVCHEPRVASLTVSTGEEIMHPRMCACERETRRLEDRIAEEKARREHVDRLRSIGIPKGLWNATFANDDAPDVPISTTCRRYVKAWPQMYREGAGILFTGGVGTGKTFYAACIANALVDMERRVLLTTVPDLMARMTNFRDSVDDMLSELCRANLVVLDDLGAERDTSYSVEQLYIAISARMDTGKPTIFTTNLSRQDMTDANDLRYKRIYDRVLGMCPIQMQLTGESRRRAAYDAQRMRVRDILRGVTLEDGGMDDDP